MPISDLLTPRKEVQEGNFQGALHAYKVEDEDEGLESKPQSLINITYPSNSLRNILDRIKDKLSGDDQQGGYLLSGPYGSGKSHGLIFLYHLFDNPDVATSWLQRWNVDLSIPGNSQSVILSTSKTDADYLWEPIFQRLGRDDLLDDINRYPTIDHIEELTSEGAVSVFLDEIETWYGSISRDEKDLIERNEFFLQNLLEVAGDRDNNLFAFISLLDKNEELKKILNRTNPVNEDLSTSGDWERIIYHRLVKTPRDELDKNAIAEIAGRYMSLYKSPIEIDEPTHYQENLERTYPFHPELLDLMGDIYESAAERQNVRGAMYVLANVLKEHFQDSDLLLTSQLDESAFRPINRQLVGKYHFDVSENDNTKDVEKANEILKSILLYTLNDKTRGARESDILLSILRPGESSIDSLTMSLSQLPGRAHYLHREEGVYQIREDLNKMALISREADRIEEEEDVHREIFQIVRNRVFSGNVTVYEEEDEIPDNDSLKFVVSLSAPESRGKLKSFLDDVYHGRKFQNTLIFIAQEGPDILQDSKITKKARRIVAALGLQGEVEDDENEIQQLIEEERDELADALSERFGRWIKWSRKESGDVDFQAKPVPSAVAEIKERIGTDRSYVGEKILDAVEGEESAGIRVDQLRGDFKQFRGYPVLLDDQVFSGAVRNLYDNGRIVLEGTNSKYYVKGKDRDPRQITPEMTLRSPDYVSEAILNPPDEDGDDPDIPGEETEDPGETNETEVKRTEKRTELFEGNSPRSILSTAEQRLNKTTDSINEISATIIFEEPINKEELLDFFENFPSAEQIDVDVEIERECD